MVAEHKGTTGFLELGKRSTGTETADGQGLPSRNTLRDKHWRTGTGADKQGEASSNGGEEVCARTRVC
jgi:hypothetical protein